MYLFKVQIMEAKIHRPNMLLVSFGLGLDNMEEQTHSDPRITEGGGDRSNFYAQVSDLLKRLHGAFLMS